jgi:hypothetical protein
MKHLLTFFSVISCCLISLLTAEAQQQKRQTSQQPTASKSAPKVAAFPMKKTRPDVETEES